MKLFLILASILIIGLVVGMQESDASCAKSKDWPSRPCFDTPPVTKTEFVEGWSPYYEYKGSELMERKKVEMFQSLENKTFEQWVKLSENNENFNIYYYYIATGEVAKQFKTHGFQVNEITSPHKQQSIYTKPYELKCRNNLQPVLFQSETYACVKEESRKKLLELNLIHENYSNISIHGIKDEYDVNSEFYITIRNEGMVPIQFESSSILIPIFQTRNQDPYDEKSLHPGEQAAQWHLFEKQLDETIKSGQHVFQINYKSDIHQKEKSFSYEINLIDTLEQGVFHLVKTTDIKDVKDEVVYTILGTISSVSYDDDPIEWATGIFIAGPEQILGFFPITISIDTVYKGNLTDDTFTFYNSVSKITGSCPNCGEFNVIPDSEKYKIGEKVLVHLDHLEHGPFPDGFYQVILGPNGKYDIQTVDGARSFDIANTSSDTLLAFNPNYPTGVPLDVVAGEAIFGNDTLSVEIIDSSSINRFESDAESIVEINPQKLRVINHGVGYNKHDPQYPPFEYGVYNSHVTVLGTVQSIETRLIDTSHSRKHFVMADGYQEAVDAYSKERWNDNYDGPSSLEIYMQYMTNQTYQTPVEEHKPYRFITLKVDQYLKDKTGEFADTLVIKTPGSGEGIQNGTKVYYSHNREYPIGEQAVYMLINYSVEGIAVYGGFDDKYTITGKYTVNDDNTIQSIYSQQVLESLERYEQKAATNNFTINHPEEHDQKIEWTLPIPLDEAIIRAQEQANTNHLIINYSISN